MKRQNSRRGLFIFFSYVVKFDTKNGFADSFLFQKCILLYTSQLQFESYGTLFFKISWLTLALIKGRM